MIDGNEENLAQVAESAAVSRRDGIAVEELLLAQKRRQSLDIIHPEPVDIFLGQPPMADPPAFLLDHSRLKISEEELANWVDGKSPERQELVEPMIHVSVPKVRMHHVFVHHPHQSQRSAAVFLVHVILFRLELVAEKRNDDVRVEHLLAIQLDEGNLPSTTRKLIGFHTFKGNLLQSQPRFHFQREWRDAWNKFQAFELIKIHGIFDPIRLYDADASWVVKYAPESVKHDTADQ